MSVYKGTDHCQKLTNRSIDKMHLLLLATANASLHWLVCYREILIQWPVYLVHNALHDLRYCRPKIQFFHVSLIIFWLFLKKPRVIMSLFFVVCYSLKCSLRPPKEWYKIISNNLSSDDAFWITQFKILLSFVHKYSTPSMLFLL